MGITRNSYKKRRATGGKQPQYRKKRQFELGRAAANTRMGVKRMRSVRVRGGHIKNRALRLDHGTFSWGSESISKPSRVLDVVYNATNNELVRTKTLVKGAIIMIDATPFRQWYMQHYGLELGRKAADDAVKKSRKVVKKQEGRVKVESAMDPAVSDQFKTGRLLCKIASRPGQSGRCDGYVLEGAELAFYIKKMQKKKGKKEAA